MRKVLFLLLLLLVLGAAGTNAQVRIGGDGVPNEAAVLDLNVDGTTTGTKGLALPRVSLSSDDVILPGVTENLDGMLVYNTNTSTSNGLSGIGIYYWDGTRWVLLQTMGVWSAATTCEECGTLAVGSTTTLSFANFGAPAWAYNDNCWVSGIWHTQYYYVFMGGDFVYVRKDRATELTPTYRLFCWGPLI